jgi:hypothetical protein
LKTLLALRRRIPHSFRRTGETEMEQLFQMATQAAKNNIAGRLIAE